jgi:hypothetical protein
MEEELLIRCFFWWSWNQLKIFSPYLFSSILLEFFLVFFGGRFGGSGRNGCQKIFEVSSGFNVLGLFFSRLFYGMPILFFTKKLFVLKAFSLFWLSLKPIYAWFMPESDGLVDRGGCLWPQVLWLCYPRLFV